MLLRHRWAWTIVAILVSGIVGQGYLGIHDHVAISIFQFGVSLLVALLPWWADPPSWWFRALRGKQIKRARQRDLYESGFKTRRPFYLVVIHPSMSLEEFNCNASIRSLVDMPLGPWWRVIDYERTQHWLVLVITNQRKRSRRIRARARRIDAVPKIAS